MATRAEWIERVVQWEESGLDAAEFAQREGLKPEHLHEWRRKLRGSTRPRSAPALGPCPPPAAAPTALPMPAWIDIALPNAGLVRLLPGVDPATLACVLAVAAELSSGSLHYRCTCALQRSPPGTRRHA